MNTRRRSLGQAWAPYTRDITKQNSTIAASATQWVTPPEPPVQKPDPRIAKAACDARAAKWTALAALILSVFAAGRAGR